MTRTPSGVLINQLAPGKGILRDTLCISGFALLTAALAQFYVRLPFTPVPLTGQTLAVLSSGAVLGSRRGFLSQVVYLGLGAAGLPVFAGGASSLAHLIGTDGGYLLSFPLAAAALGWLVERGAGRRVWTLAMALIASDLVILAGGVAWLGAVWDGSIRNALALGAYPFAASDLLKVVLLGAPLPWLLRRTGGATAFPVDGPKNRVER
jgi:biotin transport system substrate-specific component